MDFSLRNNLDSEDSLCKANISQFILILNPQMLRLGLLKGLWTGLWLGYGH